MNKPIQLKYRIPLFVFTLTLLFFITFIILETALWQDAKHLVSAKMIAGRILVAISLASIACLLTFMMMGQIMHSIRQLSLVVKNWGDAQMEGSFVAGEEEEVFDQDEIGEIARTFTITVLQNKEREDQMVKDIISRSFTELSDELQPKLFHFDLLPVKNLDVSVFPNKSSQSSCDFVSVIRCINGCAGIIGGFSNTDIQEMFYKSRLEGIFSMAEKTKNMPGEELLYHVDRAIRNVDTDKFNMTLFFMNSESGELTYAQNQDTPLLVCKKNSFKIQNISGVYRHTDFSEKTSQLHTCEIGHGESVVFLSDRICEIMFLHPNSMQRLLDEKARSQGEFKSSKDLTLFLVKALDEQAQKNSIDTLISHMALTVIRRK